MTLMTLHAASPFASLDLDPGQVRRRFQEVQGTKNLLGRLVLKVKKFQRSGKKACFLLSVMSIYVILCKDHTFGFDQLNKARRHFDI